ncbi:MAG: 4a-hydroxytetrahydrobiopterin dehydratase [Actinobacteria bacterium]|nr:4a-hydroxytetrahydrobiopterin dehydratase [Actinomycetota bacterium]
MARRLEGEELDRQLAELASWTRVGESITRTIEFPDFPTAIRGVTAVAADAEAMDHHPDMDIRWRRVTFTLSTHSEGGLTQLDIELATQIDRLGDEFSGV